MTLYERICNICEKTGLHRMTRKSEDRDLSKAIVFLSPIMKVTVEGVISASIILSLLSLVSLTLVLSYLSIALLVAFLLSLTVSLLVYFIFITYPVSVMNSYKLGLSEEADLVFEQFLIVFQAGGTIFDAIEMVANSKHPFLSAQFQEMISRINAGVSPEQCLSEFAAHQPSDDLRRYLMAILSSLEQKTDLLDMLSGESFEADTTLRQKNLEVESRLLIVAALITYLPIMLTLAVSLAGLASNLAVLLIAPLFIAINIVLRSRFSRSFSAYFDRPQNTGINPPSQDEIIREYDEFLNFMILIGERLRMGDTLEVALPEVRSDVGPEVQSIIDPAIESIYWKNGSIREALAIAQENALGQRTAGLLSMIDRMCEISAQAAGDRISRIAARLVKRSSVVKERDSIIAAQKLKVYILSITSAIVLGLLTALAPFLYIGQFLISGTEGETTFITSSDIYPLVLTLSLVTGSSGYQNVKMVDGKRAGILAILCLLLYLTSYALSTSIMGF